MADKQRVRDAPGVLMSAAFKEGTILPKKGEDNVLITSALPYVNNVPHLGNIIGSTLSADVFARYNRTRNRNTLYICGTDEYGTATETKALEDGVSPQALCDKFNALHREVYEWFEIGFDHFGRTSTPKQTEIVQSFYLNIRKNGLLQTQTREQIYSEEEGRFLADRFVEGTCPHCGYDEARGDQCDKCQRTFDSPMELLNPRSKMRPSSKLTTRPTSHMYFDLGKLQPDLERWLKETATRNNWPGNLVISSDREIVEARMKAGLQPTAITRDLVWGVPVPKTGDEEEDKAMEGKVMYVWMDAPIGYISITANYTDKWEEWWLAPDDVKLFQFMGKDNVYFHTCFFPSLLLGDGRPWTKLNYISATEYLQYEGGKFSKSRNIGVFGNNAQETGIPPSVWRFYLLSRRPENSDSEFSWNDFIGVNNNQLLKNLGNFVNRVLKFVVARLSSTVPGPSDEAGGPVASDAASAADAASFEVLEARFVADVNEILARYAGEMERAHIRSAIDSLMALSARGNQWIQDNKLDNTLLAEQPARAHRVVLLAVNLIYTLTALVHPFMPSTSTAMLAQLDAPPRGLPTAFSVDLLPGHVIGKPDYLFTNIDAKMEDVWRAKYGGASAAGVGAAAAEPQLSKKQQAKLAKEAKKKAETAVPETPEARALAEKVKAQGERVRAAKAGQELEDGKGVEGELAELKRLKGELDELTRKFAGAKV